MKKPEKKTIVRHAYDWSEAVEWIEHRLGEDVYIRDFANKFKGKNKDSENPYQDYWHFICEEQEISNPCYIYISSEWIEYGNCTDWQNKITQAFVDEFGDEAEFLVEW